MFAQSLFTALVLASYATAVSVTTPNNNTVWSSGTSGQTVSWEAVSSDPTSFVIQLVNQAGFLSNSPVTLVSNQSTGASNTVNTATVTYSSGTWPTGTGFYINLMSSSESNAAILAQGGPFNITSGGSTSNSGSSAAAGSGPTTITTSTTAAGASSATVVTVTTGSGAPTTAVGGDASGGIPNAVTTSAKTGGAGNLGVPAALGGALVAVAGLVALL